MYCNSKHTHLGQNLLYLCNFLYTSLMMTLQRSKHVQGIQVTSDYLLLIVQFV